MMAMVIEDGSGGPPDRVLHSIMRQMNREGRRDPVTSIRSRRSHRRNRRSNSEVEDRRVLSRGEEIIQVTDSD